MFKNVSCVILISLVALSSPVLESTAEQSQQKEAGFVPLFNGDDLSGWQNYAGKKWSATDGILVGPSDSAGWLGTTAIYDDFVLRLEYWIDPGVSGWSNSGIFIRADKSEKPWIDGFEVQIDLKDEKNPTGSIYNHVVTDMAQVRDIAPEKEWNRVEIRAVGATIQVWINDTQLQDATLHGRRAGVIGLQQHHPGVLVKFRNIRIKKLTSEDSGKDWISLFNGKDLDGWFIRGKAEWQVVDGILKGVDGMGHIYSETVAADCEIRGMFRVSEKGNSGLYFRCKPPADNPDGFPRGFEAQISNHGDAFTGWLWKPGTPTGRAERLITRDQHWFSMHVKAIENHIQIRVNGQLVTEYQDSEYSSGHFAIQGHNPGMTIEVRDLYYRHLNR
jgi:hypothetical protein